ncbi:MAG: hypothetical protein KME49_32750 [Brasilonema octagenarum HA4186-MV1]|nr:hypothetical protein [Brasilonema octagenarum HA4186-MV1]
MLNHLPQIGEYLIDGGWLFSYQLKRQHSGFSAKLLLKHQILTSYWLF